ncbi:MAG TPA: hypothetical protein DEW46_07880 [Verrucomicrobia bacterium]|nr:hypothetical protein [Verrucomicrobiota bacterium]
MGLGCAFELIRLGGNDQRGKAMDAEQVLGVLVLVGALLGVMTLALSGARTIDRLARTRPGTERKRRRKEDPDAEE